MILNEKQKEMYKDCMFLSESMNDIINLYREAITIFKEICNEAFKKPRININYNHENAIKLIYDDFKQIISKIKENQQPLVSIFNKINEIDKEDDTYSSIHLYCNFSNSGPSYKIISFGFNFDSLSEGVFDLVDGYLFDILCNHFFNRYNRSQIIEIDSYRTTIDITTKREYGNKKRK